MTTTVASKFRNSLWVMPVLSTLSVIGGIALIYSTSGDHSAGNLQASRAVFGILVVICLFTYRAVTRFIKVTVTPNALLLHYLLNGKRRTVDYESIIHVALVRDYSGDGSSQR